MNNRERARASDKKQRRPILLEEKHEKFIGGGGGENMRNASGHQGENKRQRKKVIWNTYNISSIKWVTRKFHVVVVQNNGKKCTKKCVARAKLSFC